MIIRQQKTLSNNHYISTWKNAKTAFFITICAAESGIEISVKNVKNRGILHLDSSRCQAAKWRLA
ncbi:MAG: hypothetical protein NC337_07275 [Roseburia sp.]|nr:hypothetical protein [Roseburia sp.]